MSGSIKTQSYKLASEGITAEFYINNANEETGGLRCKPVLSHVRHEMFVVPSVTYVWVCAVVMHPVCPPSTPTTSLPRICHHSTCPCQTRFSSIVPSSLHRQSQCKAASYHNLPADWLKQSSVKNMFITETFWVPLRISGLLGKEPFLFTTVDQQSVTVQHSYVYPSVHIRVRLFDCLLARPGQTIAFCLSWPISSLSSLSYWPQSPHRLAPAPWHYTDNGFFGNSQH